MNELSAIRYLVARGWTVVEEDFLSLTGHYEEPVCVDTAYELQKMLEQMRVAA